MRQELLNEKYEALDDLRRFMMAELALIDVVKKEVEVVLAKLEQTAPSSNEEEDDMVEDMEQHQMQ